MPHTDLFIKFSKFERATEFRLPKKSEKSYIGILNALGPAVSDSNLHALKTGSSLHNYTYIQSPPALVP